MSVRVFYLIGNSTFVQQPAHTAWTNTSRPCPHFWSPMGNPPVTNGIPKQRTSNAKSFHHATSGLIMCTCVSSTLRKDKLYTTVTTCEHPGISFDWQLYLFVQHRISEKWNKKYNATLLIVYKENPLMTNGLAIRRDISAINHRWPIEYSHKGHQCEKPLILQFQHLKSVRWCLITDNFTVYSTACI